jgi:N-acetylglucosamine kinase-like BadF-type ATPase
MALQPLPVGFATLGIDAGGTKTLIEGRAGNRSVRLETPGTNFQRDGVEVCADRLAAAVTRVLEDLPAADAVALCAGVAGAGRKNDQSLLSAALRERLAPSAPALMIEIVSDGLLALEAAFQEGEGGLVVMVGTGSMLLLRTASGQVLRAGGWGRLIGDPGSGTAIGRDAMQAVADDFDGGEPTIIRHRLAETHGVERPEDLIRLIHSPNFNPAEFAPMVIEAAAVPDWAATRILQKQANALALRGAWLARRAEDEGGAEVQVALVGGMARSVHYREVLAEAILRHLPRCRIVRPHAAPEDAALGRAARLATA